MTQSESVFDFSDILEAIEEAEILQDLPKFKRELISTISFEIEMYYLVQGPEYIINLYKKKLDTSFDLNKLLLKKYITLPVTNEMIDTLFKDMCRYQQSSIWYNDTFPPSDNDEDQLCHEKGQEFLESQRLKIESKKEFIINN